MLIVAVSVVPMPSDGWREVAPVVARAIEDQPFAVAVYDKSHGNPAAMDACMRLAFRSFLLGGMIVDTTPNLSAAAAWVPPGHTDSPVTTLRVLPQVVAWLRGIGFSDARRLKGVNGRLDRWRIELLPEPHWCLAMLAVDPAKQRFGLGAILTRHGLARADATGAPAFVQTDTAAKARFYEKLGFTIVEERTDDKLPLTIWSMVHRVPTQPAGEPAQRVTATAMQ